MDLPSFVDELPSALDGGLETRLAGRRPALFLDFDGTLAPIVRHADQAKIPEAVRRALVRLARRFPVAIVSGRDRTDVEKRVGLEGVYYAGSHGFDISGPGGFHELRGQDFRPVLDRAAVRLEEETGGLDGVWIEKKAMAVATHYRQASEGAEARVWESVRRVAAEFDNLKVSGGKKVFELRPDIEWDKGRAVMWLLDVLDLNGPATEPIFIGDDETDEDVFVALAHGHGTGIVVGTEHRLTAATYALSDTDQVAALLDWLSEIP